MKAKLEKKKILNQFVFRKLKQMFTTKKGEKNDYILLY